VVRQLPPDSPQEPSTVRGGAVAERPGQPLHGHGADDDRNSLRSAWTQVFAGPPDSKMQAKGSTEARPNLVF
jgi:hypothetical protein